MEHGWDGLQSGFLGLQNEDDNPDIAIIPVPYELTTSYGHGTVNGPKSCIEASWQVELFDDKLEDEIPAGFKIHTAPFWETDKGTLAGQLDELLNLQSTGIKIMPSLFLSGESMVFYHRSFEDLGTISPSSKLMHMQTFARNLMVRNTHMHVRRRGQWMRVLLHFFRRA